MGLVVEGLQMGRATRHAQVNNVLCLCSVMLDATRRSGRCVQIQRVNKRAQSYGSQTLGAAVEERATIDEVKKFVIHDL